MERTVSIIFFLCSLIILFHNTSEAEKTPIWEWESQVPVNHVSISDNSRNISAVYSNSLSYWKNETSTPWLNETADTAISSMEASSEGKYVLIGEESEPRITLWKEGNKEWSTTDFLFTVKDLDITPNGSYLAVVDFNNLYLFSKSSNQPLWSKYHEGQVMTAVAVSLEGEFIAVGTDGGKVFVYPFEEEGDLVLLHENAVDGAITGIDFSLNGDYIVFGTEEGKVYVYQTQGDGDPFFEHTQEHEVTSIICSSNNVHFAFGTSAGLLKVVNFTSNFLWQKDIGGSVSSISFNGKGNHVFAGSNSKILLLADAVSGEELWRTSVFDSINSVSSSFRGENVIVATDKGLALYYVGLLDNQAPVVEIESITPSIALLGTQIAMNATAIDIDGEVISYLWNSSIDGIISNKLHFSISNLSMGLHLISFSAQDNNGRWSKEAVMEIGVGDFPQAKIDSVTGCDLSITCIINQGDLIEFEGNASSTASEESEIVGYRWYSDRDNLLSSNSSFTTASLSFGIHNISFSAVNNIGFWSSNVTISLLINGVPTSEILDISPIQVQPGSDVILTAFALDPDGGSVTYIWSSKTLFFANGKKSFESSETNGSRVVTSDSNIGSVHEIFLRVKDVYEAYSVESSIKIEVMSSPFIESLQCEAEAILNKELLFNVLAGDKDGRIVLYEWDFDSLSGTIDSIDYQGPEPIGAVTTYSYNATPTGTSYYTVVVRVTDDDGLLTRGTCTVDIVSPEIIISDDSSSSSSIESITDFASPPIIGGALAGILVLGLGGYYFYNRESAFSYTPSESYSSNSSSVVQDSKTYESNSNSSKLFFEPEPEVDMMTIECPSCSSRMNIPKVTGIQQVSCNECGLEGEMEI